MLTTIAFLLPHCRFKLWLLRRAGHDIDPTVRIGINLVRGVAKFELAAGVRIGHGNIFRGLALVRMGRGAMIHQFNWISGDSGHYPDEDEHGMLRQLHMGPYSHVLSRHYLDCGGGIDLREDTWVTGVRSTIFSHSVDPVNGGFMFEPVVLGRGAMIATSCTVLPGTSIGEGVLLAAGSVTWPKQQLNPESMYGGSPARRLSPVQISDFCYNHNRYAGD